MAANRENYRGSEPTRVEKLRKILGRERTNHNPERTTREKSINRKRNTHDVNEQFSTIINHQNNTSTSWDMPIHHKENKQAELTQGPSWYQAELTRFPGIWC